MFKFRLRVPNLVFGWDNYHGGMQSQNNLGFYHGLSVGAGSSKAYLRRGHLQAQYLTKITVQITLLKI
jgi:hypothetical protein